MRMLTPAEYCTLCSGPEGLADPVLFESLLDRRLLVVIHVDPVTGYSFTDISPLGYLAKRVYEAVYLPAGATVP